MASIVAKHSLLAAGGLPKRRVQAAKGGTLGLQIKVNSLDEAGVFSPVLLEAGSPVEICPLLEIDTDLRAKSGVLKKHTVLFPRTEGKWGIPLGFAQVYKVSQEPNTAWGYVSDDELLLWVVDTVKAGEELSVDFGMTPQSADEAAARIPSSWQKPPASDPSTFEGKKQEVVGNIIYGNSALHGRGVFVTRSIAPGQMIESCRVLKMDEAGAEALQSYRWGLADEERDGGDFFVPMGFGSLYNHSETPNACAKLDRDRQVMEFAALEPLHTGQEVLVNYGSKYFQGNFFGHRKDDLLQVVEHRVEDEDMLAFGELAEAVLHALSQDNVRAELMRLRRPTEKPPQGETPEQRKARFKAIGELTRKAHEVVLKAEIPILERFGFTKDHQGAMHMQMYINKMRADERATPEMQRTTDKIKSIVNGDPEPASESWLVTMATSWGTS